MKKNLIIARCGPTSLHPHWLIGAEPNFDLVVTYFGDVVPDAWLSQGYPIIPIKGPKWRGLHDYLSRHPSWREYERIFFPDDDLMFDARLANALFDSARRYHTDLCQPSLDDRSHGSHTITLSHGSFKGRVTNFVELMCPLMSKRFLEVCQPLFQESDSGWGMDSYWAQLLFDKHLQPPMIFDQHAITHTRAVGSASNGTNGQVRPVDDLKAFKAKHHVIDEPHLTVAGILKDGQLLDAWRTREKLALALIRDATNWHSRDPQLVVTVVRDVLATRTSRWLSEQHLALYDTLLRVERS